ncbi:MAG: tyrosine--tRNA ligase, partial [Candidatus Woesearchaeota archaeon]
EKIKVERPEKFGGNVEYNSYKELESDFEKGKLHPMDLKNTASFYLNEIVKPVREHFESNPEAKKLKEQVDSFKVTR